MLEWLRLSRIGLIYDIAGAGILAYSQLRIGARELKEANLFWREHIDERNLRLARNDAMWGFALLLTGFFLQLLGSAQKPQSLDSCIVIILGLALAVSITGYFARRARIFSDYEERVAEEERKKREKG